MVFQNYALYPHLSVGENIAFGLRLRKTAKSVINERVAWAAKMLDLTPYLDRRPKELSGGQRQRVAMGRAIVRQPQVFLMDEPLSNLDAKLRVQMRADIAKLQRELGMTTIYVTHDQIEAMTMGDRVAVMSKGVLQQVDAPQRLYDRPENLFVAGFIGTPPMNLLEGTRLGERRHHGRPRRARPRDRGRGDHGAIRACASTTGASVIVGLRPGDLHPGPGPQRPTADPGAGRARRVARRRVDGVLQASMRARSRARRTRSTSRSRRREPRRASSDRGRTSSPSFRRTSSACGSMTRSRSRSTSRGLHFFDEPIGCAAPLARASPPSPRLRSESPSRAPVRGPPPRARRCARSSPAARSHSSLASQRIYFVMPDRYANGDRPTTPAVLTGPRTMTGFDPTDTGLFHGGDYKGLTGMRTVARPRADQESRLHRPLGDAAVLNQPRERQRGLPRVLGPRLHARRPASRHRPGLRRLRRLAHASG